MSALLREQELQCGREVLSTVEVQVMEYITLLHSCFSLSGGTSGECNDGAFVGQSLRVEDNYYTSRLNVTITPDMTGRSITCIHDNGTTTDIISRQTITTTVGIYSVESL